MTQLENADRNQTTVDRDPFHRVVDGLDANFPKAPGRRAAHAKGVVAYGTFTATPDARSLSRAGHFAGQPVQVVARFSNFPGGAPHHDAAPECNPRGLAVQFRLDDGSTTDLLAHSIDGFPGRTIDDFGDFLEAISPQGAGPEQYLAGHAAAAAFVQAVQAHRPPASYAALDYFAVNAFCFHNEHGSTIAGRYTWKAQGGQAFLGDDEITEAAFGYLGDELIGRLGLGPVMFDLVLTVAEPGDITDDANAKWPDDRHRVVIGTLQLTALASNSELTEQGLFFDPVRLIDGITISDDPLLVGRTLTYPISLARRHEGT